MEQKRSCATLRLESALARKLRYIAQADGRTVNNYIENLIRKDIARFELENGKIPLA